jgi:hypothetical protein
MGTADSDSEAELTEEEAFMHMLVEARATPEIVTTMMVVGIETADQFLGQHGMMENAGAAMDAGVLGLLARLRAHDLRVDGAITGAHASCIRTLILKAKKALNGPAGGRVSNIVVKSAAGTVASSEAEESKEATALYKQLLATQGVDVDSADHLNHSLIAKMVSSLRKNGHINACICLGDMYRQNERKRTTAITIAQHVEVNIGGNQVAADADVNTSFSKVVLKLLLFCKALAAVFGKEVTKTVDVARYSTLQVKPVKGTHGSHMLVHASYPDAMQYFEILVVAMSSYAVRFADSIFKRSFAKLMSLFDRHGFKKALNDLKEMHSSHLRPSDEEVSAFENEKRHKATLNERVNREHAERKAGDKARRESGAAKAAALAATGATTGGAATGAKKPEDPAKSVCHGVVYSGICRRDGCTFDHHKERCAAYKLKYPAGRP